MLQLPYSYWTMPFVAEDLNITLKWISNKFNKNEISLDNFEIKKTFLKATHNSQILKSGSSLGFTILHSVSDFKCNILASNIDLAFDGVFEEVLICPGTAFVLENHIVACLNISNPSKVEVISLLTKDEVTLSNCFSLHDTINEDYLSLWINHDHFLESNLNNYCDTFIEDSVITITNFLRPEKIIEILSSQSDHKAWELAGPTDYRCFRVNNEFNNEDISTFFMSVSFKSWLSKLTGLPIVHPASPIYTRCLESPGNYQILHGNYSEPFGIDLIFNYYAKESFQEWSESFCGRVHYLDNEGNEIFQVSPQNNSLTIVYRSEGCSRFTENIKGFPEFPLFQSIAIFRIAKEAD